MEIELIPNDTCDFDLITHKGNGIMISNEFEPLIWICKQCAKELIKELQAKVGEM